MMKRPILKNLWAIKITIITFVLAILFSFLSQIATSSSQLFVPYMVLIFMIFISIITDAIAVSVKSCDVDRLFFLTKGKNFEYEIILKMVCNADKVNNICADVIGDMCGILSGACGATIVAKADNLSYNYINAICVSSLIVAITVGGKAYMKDIAIHSSEEYLISCIKLLKIFIRKKDGNYRKNKFSKRFKKS